MAEERLVAVSYPVDDEFVRINAEVLDRDASLAFLPRLGTCAATRRSARGSTPGGTSPARPARARGSAPHTRSSARPT